MKQIVCLLIVTVAILAAVPIYAVQLPAWPYDNTDWSQVRITQDYGCRGLGYLLLGNNPKDKYLQELDCVKKNQSHTGLDFGAPKDANGNTFTDDTHLTIKPILAGKVVNYCSYAAEGDANSSCSHNFGNWVITENVGSFTCPYALYAHLKWNTIKDVVKNSKANGTSLTESDSIGIMGESGGVDRHLHFECKMNPVISSPDGKDDAPVGGNINFAYTNDHPSGHGYLDPMLTLGTITSKILHVPVTTARVNIRRGPGKKYSVFAQAVQTQNFVAFAHATATDDDGTYRWYRIDLPCTSESSCAGWIREDATEIETWDPMSTAQDALYQTGGKQILYLNSNVGAVNVRSIPTTLGNTPLGSVTGDQVFGIAFPPQTGDSMICLCWFPLVTPEYVSNKQHFSWICGGIPSGEGITIPSCPNAKVGSTVTKTPDLSDITLAGAVIPYTPNPEEDPIIPPPPNPVPPPPDIPPGASLAVTTRDSPLQMETLVQGSMQPPRLDTQSTLYT